MAATGRMLGSGCAGLILHTLYSVLFMVWLVLALAVQLVTVSLNVIRLVVVIICPCVYAAIPASIHRL